MRRLFAWLAIKAISFILALPVVLFVYWVIWLVWCWTLPQLWITGPVHLIRPGYWLFAATLLIATTAGRWASAIIRGK